MEKPFENLRPVLENLFSMTPLDPATGPEEAVLYQQAEAFCKAHADMPHQLLRAEVESIILENGRIAVNPADRFPCNFEHTKILIDLHNCWRQEAYAASPETVESENVNFQRGGGWAQMDLSHTCPDWESLLSLGIPGLIERAGRALAKAETEEQRVFASSVLRLYRAFQTFTGRFAKRTRELGCTETADTLDFLVGHAPETFRQALHLMLLYDQVQEFEGEMVRTQGRFDQLFYRFYRHDLDCGILTRDGAKELLKFCWIRHYAVSHGTSFGKNYNFGGCNPDGSDGCNDLTAAALETYFELKVPDPKLIFRYSAQTPEKYLRLAARCLKHGLTAIVFCNDDVLIPTFLQQGKSLTEARNSVLVGCYEPAVMGEEMPCTMAGLINLTKPVELAFNNGCDFSGARLGPECPLPENFEAFESEYFRQLKTLMQSVLERIRFRQKLWKEVNPSPMLSGTMKHCMEVSLADVSAGGAKYTSSGIMCGCIGSAADSLAAVEYLTVNGKLCDLKTLQQALKANWKGFEELQKAAKFHAPKWGNGNSRADHFARKIAETLKEIADSGRNLFGGRYQIGNWSINWNVMFGKVTGALPDGRCAGEVLSRNNNAVSGMDRCGITALMRSAVSIDQKMFPDGSVLDLMLHPSAVSGSDGEEVLCGLIRSFAKLGGQSLQFNILDAETLKKAQRNPARYNSIQIRVCGWNNRFVDLSPVEQQNFIRQAEAMV